MYVVLPPGAPANSTQWFAIVDYEEWMNYTKGAIAELQVTKHCGSSREAELYKNKLNSELQ